MKKNIILIVLCIIILVVALTIFAVIKNRAGKIVMVTEAGFAPYEYYDNKNIVGVDVKIAEAIAEELGKELEIKNTNFDLIIDEVKLGSADFAAAGLSITEDRLKEVDFSIEYAVSKQVIIVKNGSDIQTVEDLNDKKVSVQAGTIGNIVLKEDYPEIKVVERKKYSLAVKDVLTGNSAAVVMDSLPAEQVVKDNQDLEILTEELFTDRYGIAVKKGNKELLETINKVLKKLIDEGKITEYTLEYLKR